MIKWYLSILLLSFSGLSAAQASGLQAITDKNIVEDLTGIVSMIDNNKNHEATYVMIMRVQGPGECDGPDYGKDCPSEKLLVAVCNRGEGRHPDMALYRTDPMYNFEFVRWRPDVKKVADQHGFTSVVFEAKAQKGGPNYKVTDIKYLISVTPWTSQIEIIK